MSTKGCVHLLKAPNKKFIDECFLMVAARGALSEEAIAALGTNPSETAELIASIKYIVETSVRDNLQPLGIFIFCWSIDSFG